MLYKKWIIKKHKDDIDFYINSLGGDAHGFFAIYDIMQTIESKINTYGLGVCSSGGCFLLASGTGKRSIYSNGMVLLHGLQAAIAYGSYEERKHTIKRLDMLQNNLIKLIVKHTNQNWEQVEEDIKRDRWLSAEEALEYGIVDEIIGAD